MDSSMDRDKQRKDALDMQRKRKELRLRNEERNGQGSLQSSKGGIPLAVKEGGDLQEGIDKKHITGKKIVAYKFIIISGVINAVDEEQAKSIKRYLDRIGIEYELRNV